MKTEVCGHFDAMSDPKHDCSGWGDTSPSEWRESREPGWYRDVGYLLQEVLQSHRYDYKSKGSKPDDPGWHECTCGWAGYWSGFEPHVADHLRAVVTDGR